MWVSSERAGELAGESIRCTFEAGRLHGTKLPVLDGMLARPCVVLARDKQGRCRLLLCDLEGEGTERDRIDSIDPSQPVARVRFAGTPAEELGRSLDGLADYGNLINRAAILLAFEQIGAADRALWMARDYALDRRAFGRPIGANQAIKHKLTMVYQRNEVARAHAYYGAWALSTESPELLLAAAGARLAATEALCFAAQENIQTHGGIGFTWESDCQLFYRRARFCALALGGTAQWQEQAMRALERKQEAEAAGGF
jgi:alkylation response protein AidB-like acyl-CoA dehydrogenase